MTTAQQWNATNPAGTSVLAGGYFAHTLTAAWDTETGAHLRVYGAGIWPCASLQLARRDAAPAPPPARLPRVDRARRNLAEM